MFGFWKARSVRRRELLRGILLGAMKVVYGCIDGVSADVLQSGQGIHRSSVSGGC